MEFKDLILKAFAEIETILQDEHAQRKEDGDPRIPRLELNLVGQAALLLSPAAEASQAAGDPYRATAELDAFSVPVSWPRFHDIRAALMKFGIPIDDMSSEIWMPNEAIYTPFFPVDEIEDTLLKVAVADQEAILVSKAKFNRPKDRAILDSYLASGLPTQRFWDMLESHKIELG